MSEDAVRNLVQSYLASNPAAREQGGIPGVHSSGLQANGSTLCKGQRPSGSVRAHSKEHTSSVVKEAAGRRVQWKEIDESSGEDASEDEGATPQKEGGQEKPAPKRQRIDLTAHETLPSPGRSGPSSVSSAVTTDASSGTESEHGSNAMKVLEDHLVQLICGSKQGYNSVGGGGLDGTDSGGSLEDLFRSGTDVSPSESDHSYFCAAYSDKESDSYSPPGWPAPGDEERSLAWNYDPINRSPIPTESSSGSDSDGKAPPGTDSCKRGNPNRMCGQNVRVTNWACTIFARLDQPEKALRKIQIALHQQSALNPTWKIASVLHSQFGHDPHLHLFIHCDRNVRRNFILKTLSCVPGVTEDQIQYLWNAYSPLGYLGYMNKRGQLNDPHSLTDKFEKLAPTQATNKKCKEMVQEGRISEAMTLYPQVMRQRWMKDLIGSNFTKPHRTTLYYIWGKTGIGKTTYCKNMAKKEGWTCDETNIVKGFYLGYDKDRTITNDAVIVDDVHLGRCPPPKDINNIHDANSKFQFNIKNGSVLNNAKVWFLTSNEPPSGVWDDEYKEQIARRMTILRMIKQGDHNYLCQTTWEGALQEPCDKVPKPLGPVDVTNMCIEDEDTAQGWNMFDALTKAEEDTLDAAAN